jgi:hypothetical protein
VLFGECILLCRLSVGRGNLVYVMPFEDGIWCLDRHYYYTANLVYSFYTCFYASYRGMWTSARPKFDSSHPLANPNRPATTPSNDFSQQFIGFRLLRIILYSMIQMLQLLVSYPP